MREQKKEPTPAKGLTRIGNRNMYGNSNLHKGRIVCNAIKDGRNMGYLLRNMQSGCSTFLKVFRALEAHYMPFLDADFRESFDKTVQGEYAE
jgi:hypothetical protein